MQRLGAAAGAACQQHCAEAATYYPGQVRNAACLPAWQAAGAAIASLPRRLASSASSHLLFCVPFARQVTVSWQPQTTLPAACALRSSPCLAANCSMCAYDDATACEDFYCDPGFFFNETTRQCEACLLPGCGSCSNDPLGVRCIWGCRLGVLVKGAPAQLPALMVPPPRTGAVAPHHLTVLHPAPSSARFSARGAIARAKHGQPPIAHTAMPLQCDEFICCAKAQMHTRAHDPPPPTHPYTHTHTPPRPFPAHTQSSTFPRPCSNAVRRVHQQLWMPATFLVGSCGRHVRAVLRRGM